MLLIQVITVTRIDVVMDEITAKVTVMVMAAVIVTGMVTVTAEVMVTLITG